MYGKRQALGDLSETRSIKEFKSMLRKIRFLRPEKSALNKKA
jgi:hypothetical protein